LKEAASVALVSMTSTVVAGSENKANSIQKKIDTPTAGLSSNKSIYYQLAQASSNMASILCSFLIAM
jgi:hypothetical protein